MAAVIDQVPEAAFKRDVRAAVARYEQGLAAHARSDSSYGVPYTPDIWGAGKTIQEFGVRQWMLRRGWPDLVPVESFINALNFDLGVHPGNNNASFVSGVGAHSATVAYGFDRADWTYIPGGVISGTALIRPDLPELKIWPYSGNRPSTSWAAGRPATCFWGWRRISSTRSGHRPGSSHGADAAGHRFGTGGSAPEAGPRRRPLGA